MTGQEESPGTEIMKDTPGSVSDIEENKPALSITIPDDVSNLLDDISPAAPTGVNPETSDDQDTVVMYMTLETEMSKLSNNDYALCVGSARDLLKDKTKHLRIAVWLLTAWFRTESIAGLRKGLLVILELLKKYKNTLYPEKSTQRAMIIQSIATEGRIKLIEKVEVNSGNADVFEEIEKIFQMIIDECNEQFKAKPPKLTSLVKIIDNKASEARKLQEKSVKAAPEPGITKQPEREPVVTTSTASRESKSSPSVTHMAAVPSQSQQPNIVKEKDAAMAMKRALLFYFEEPGNVSNRKVPEDASIYGMSRILRWGKCLALPPHRDSVTEIEPPNQPKQAYIEKLVTSKDYNVLIPEIEVNFINKDEFLYWFDAQQFVVKALEERGGTTLDAAQEIKLHLARLLSRHPDFPTLLFRDKKTPFANSETRQWIEEDVRGILGGKTKQDMVLLPIYGEDYEEINKTFESFCAELPANFEKNAQAIQNSIERDIRPKGRFLRLLSLANYCYIAGKYNVASILLHDLDRKVREYNILEWEQALCVSVWQSTYLNNQKLIKTDLPQQQIEIIIDQQNGLIDLIGRYDCIRAMKLTNHKLT